MTPDFRDIAGVNPTFTPITRLRSNWHTQVYHPTGIL